MWVCMWRSEGNSQESVLSFHGVDPKAWTLTLVVGTFIHCAISLAFKLLLLTILSQHREKSLV